MTFEQVVKARETQENIDELKRWHKLHDMSQSIQRAKELCRDVLGELEGMYGKTEAGEPNPADEAMLHLSHAIADCRRAYLCMPKEDEKPNPKKG